MMQPSNTHSAYQQSMVFQNCLVNLVLSPPKLEGQLLLWQMGPTRAPTLSDAVSTRPTVKSTSLTTIPEMLNLVASLFSESQIISEIIY